MALLSNITVMQNNSCETNGSNTISSGYTENILTTIFLVMIGTGAICGNSIILAAIVLKRKNNQQIQTRIIFGLVGSMAVADMSVGLFALPHHIYTLWIPSFTITDILCLLAYSLDVMLCTSSIFHIVMMGIDRYLAICKPLYHRSEPNSVLYVLIGISWIIPALLAFPVILSKGHLMVNDNVQCLYCEPTWFLNIEYRIFASLICFYIPTFVVFGLYVRIYVEIKRRSYNFTQKNEMKITSIDKAATKTIGLILSCFLVSWTPFFVINLFFNVLYGPHLNRIARISELWAYFNSVLNPIVYYRCNNCINSAVRQLFACTKPKKSKKFVYNTGSLNERSLNIVQLNPVCSTPIPRFMLNERL